MTGLLVLLSGGALGFALWRMAEIANARDAAQAINAVGGMESPWAQIDVPPSVAELPEFQQQVRPVAVDVDLWEMQPTVPHSQRLHLSQTEPWPPSPTVSAPVSTSPTSQVQPAVEAVATTPLATSCTPEAVALVEAAMDGPAILSPEWWLDQHKEVFPIAPPPADLESDEDKLTFAMASGWVAKAIAMGVSQNKIVTVVFGQSKGTATYRRIVDLYRELKND
jgi:hypothetical protein